MAAFTRGGREEAARDMNVRVSKSYQGGGHASAVRQANHVLSGSVGIH